MIFFIQQHVLKDFCDCIIWMEKYYRILRYTYAYILEFYIFNYKWEYLWEESNNSNGRWIISTALYNKNAPRNRSIFEENFCPWSSGGIYNE